MHNAANLANDHAVQYVCHLECHYARYNEGYHTGHYAGYYEVLILVRAECVRCPWLLA